MKSKSKSDSKKFLNPILLSPAQLKSRQKQLLIIDIRSWLEYWTGHIPGAQKLSQSYIFNNIEKDQAIAVTCLSGHRSAIVAHRLIDQGYRQVYNLQGGLLAWQSAGYTIQRGHRP